MNTINSPDLNDDYMASGNTVESFIEILESLDKMTAFIPVKSKDLELFSVISEDNGEILMARHCPGEKMRIGKVKREYFLERNATPRMIEELVSGTKLMLRVDRRYYFTARSSFINSIGARLSLGGDTLHLPNSRRDAYFASLFKQKEFSGLLMARQNQQAAKTFYIFSKKYKPVPQMILADIIDRVSKSMGKTVCLQWSVDQYISSIYLEFPEKAKEIKEIYALPDEFIPGIYLATSDVGTCSVTANEMWRIGKSVTTGRVCKNRHTGGFDLEEMMEGIEQSVFEKFTLLPQRLCELLTINLTDPVKALTDAISKIELGKAVGKNVRLLTKSLKEEINPARAYTAYDIAVMLMSLPERCDGLKPYAMKKLEVIAAKAPYVDYAQSEKSTVVLMTA